jgi:hypothetical protein
MDALTYNKLYVFLILSLFYLVNIILVTFSSFQVLSCIILISNKRFWFFFPEKELFPAFFIKLLDISKMNTGISFSTWNIDGIFNRVLGDKNKDFIDSISEIDFIFITKNGQTHV